MDTIVLKFGGSSVADNIKLNIVAEKIINFYNQGNKIIVVVSAVVIVLRRNELMGFFQTLINK